MPKTLKVLEIGDKRLWEKTKPVKNPESKEVLDLAKGLINICKKTGGVGIASNQVGKNIDLFIVWSKPNKNYPKAPKFGPEVVINPKILSKSKKEVKEFEGCLSVPGIRAKILRSKNIEVSYTNLGGIIVKQKFSDFVARIFQHEFDHLQGTLILDKANPKEIFSTKEFKKLSKKK
ncbi:MAG: peptide deformylase [Candidatus Paceibacterota bacterium]